MYRYCMFNTVCSFMKYHKELIMITTLNDPMVKTFLGHIKIKKIELLMPEPSEPTPKMFHIFKCTTNDDNLLHISDSFIGYLPSDTENIEKDYNNLCLFLDPVYGTQHQFMLNDFIDILTDLYTKDKSIKHLREKNLYPKKYNAATLDYFPAKDEAVELVPIMTEFSTEEFKGLYFDKIKYFNPFKNIVFK
jgi:hypothetical protein